MLTRDLFVAANLLVSFSDRSQQCLTFNTLTYLLTYLLTYYRAKSLALFELFATSCAVLYIAKFNRRPSDNRRQKNVDAPIDFWRRFCLLYPFGDRYLKLPSVF